MNILFLVIAFCLVAGISLIICNLIQVDMMEGMALSVLIIIVSSFLSVLISVIHPIIIIVILLLLFYLLVSFTQGQSKRSIHLLTYLQSPPFIALCVLLIISFIIYHGAMILNIEELGLWASADKYMYQFRRLYHYNGHAYLQGSSFFQLYFLKMSGYQEATIYMANALLYWTGLLLPCTNMREKDRPRIILYILIMHLGLYSIYMFGSKTCSPDIPFACWAGGLLGWWSTRRRKKEKIWVFLAGLILLLTLGGISKLPIIAMIAVFPFLQYWILQSSSPHVNQNTAIPSPESDGKKSFPILLILFVLVTLGILIALHFLILKMNPDSGKAVEVFFECLIEKNLSFGKSDLNFTFLFGFALVIILFLISYEQKQAAKEIIFYIGYIIYTAIVYCCALFFGILPMEKYTGVEYLEGLQRALSVYIVFILVLCISWMICDRKHDNNRMIYAPGILLLLIFLYGVNYDYITNTTAAYPEKSAYYADIQKVKKEIEYLDQTLDFDQKIYMINQAVEDESEEVDPNRGEAASAYASYMLGSRVNDFRTTVWRFSMRGGRVYRQEDPYQSLWELPSVLKKGKYDYVWIYRPDTYLTEYLPQILGNQTAETSNKDNIEADNDQDLISSDTLYGGQIYKVVNDKKNKKKLLLKFYDSVIKYENRKEYFEWNDIN